MDTDMMDTDMTAAAAYVYLHPDTDQVSVAVAITSDGQLIFAYTFDVEIDYADLEWHPISTDYTFIAEAGVIVHIVAAIQRCIDAAENGTLSMVEMSSGYSHIVNKDDIRVEYDFIIDDALARSGQYMFRLKGQVNDKFNYAFDDATTFLYKLDRLHQLLEM